MVTSYEVGSVLGDHDKSRGVMDNASAYGAEDCGFKSHRGCLFCY